MSDFLGDYDIKKDYEKILENQKKMFNKKIRRNK